MIHHGGWVMEVYHILGSYVISSVTIAYAALAVVRLRPRLRRRKPELEGGR